MNQQSESDKIAEPPGATLRVGRRILATLFRKRSLLAAISDMREMLGDVFTVNAPGFKSSFVAGPTANRTVLVTDRHKLAWRNDQDAVTKLLRHGLLVEDDQEHERLRGWMDPPLSKRLASSNIDRMRKEVDYACRSWVDGSELDMLDEMRRISLLILMRVTFDWDFRKDLDRMWDPILASIRYISPGLWLIWPSMPRPWFNRRLGRLNEYLYEMISARRKELSSREEGPDSSDLLGVLILSGMDDDRIRDQVLTMLIAGHDTSTAHLAWTLFLLGSHPETVLTVRKEVDHVLDGRPIGPKDLGDLNYLDCVSKEALRLYPPIHVGNRRVREDVTVKGCPIVSGSRLMYSIYLTHRHPGHWEDPDAFNPARFKPDAPRRESLSYVPFGGGPRNCIGASFAQIQAKVVLSRVLQNFDLELIDQKVRPHMGATLEPRPGVRMRVRSRAKSLFSPGLTRISETPSSV